jgi:hypothetical protein|tara:strand:- start:3319 stop:3459 length:141 start_codon:yes stop_codon:yes gene_type:complete
MDVVVKPPGDGSLGKLDVPAKRLSGLPGGETKCKLSKAIIDIFRVK